MHTSHTELKQTGSKESIFLDPVHANVVLFEGSLWIARILSYCRHSEGGTASQWEILDGDFGNENAQKEKKKKNNNNCQKCDPSPSTSYAMSNEDADRVDWE